MYLQNKYTTWYYSIIRTAQSRSITGYCERHHIIPKSLGGSNSKENIVPLTAREHLMCHLLLTKMTVGAAQQKMVRASFLLTSRNKVNSKIYESLRTQYSKIRKENSKGSKNHFYGKTHTELSLQRMRESIDKTLTVEKRANIKYARTMWRHNQANKDLWAMSELLYTAWCNNGDPYGFNALEKMFGLKKSSTQNIVCHFVNGWNPLDDAEFQNWKTDYLSR